MKRIITTDDATGNVLSQWAGGDEQELAPVASRTHRTLQAGDAADYSEKRWTGTAFVSKAARPVRVISPLDFARRFTLAEEGAIDTLSDSNKTVKAWMRRLTLATSVNLDHQDVIAGLAYMKAVGVPAIWPDEATADTRITAIRA